jgi:hypothetical protein
MDESTRRPTPGPGERIERTEVVQNTSDATRRPAPGERVERHEVVERVASDAAPPPRATPMWVWVLPLVLVVLALAWFIFARGEPADPLSSLPDVDVDPVVEQTRIEAPTVEISPPPVIEVVPGPAPASETPSAAASPSGNTAPR